MNTITDDRQMRTLTGLDLAAFCALAEPFAVGCQQEADARFASALLFLESCLSNVAAVCRAVWLLILCQSGR